MNNKIKKLINKLPYPVRNRYFISGIVFLIWISFFDTNSFFTQIKKKQEINNMKKDIEYYMKEIQKDETMINLLSQDSLTPELEKLFREELFLSRKNEEIFIIE